MTKPLPKHRRETSETVPKHQKQFNKMQPTNPNAHMYVNRTAAETHREENLVDVVTCGCNCRVWSVECKV